MPNPLTEANVLEAFHARRNSTGTYTAYIADELRIRYGYDGGVKKATLLRRLRALEARGVLERSGLSSGGYGYHWTWIGADQKPDHKEQST